MFSILGIYLSVSSMANGSQTGISIDPAPPIDLKTFLALVVLTSCSAVSFATDLRIGVIGCDTSHVTAFTETLNDPQAKNHIPGGRVVAAYQGGSQDIPVSWNRVEQYSKTLRDKYGVQFYDSIPELCRHVDAVLLESVDGRPHLDQFKQVLAARKHPVPANGAALLVADPLSKRQPVFIDKPTAASLRDVQEIFRLAKAAHVPVFSSSALRFAKDTQAVRHGSLGQLHYAETFGPCEREPHHPDLFWYGVHGVEALYTIMGTGCQTVQRGITPDGKIEVIGTWSANRKGVFREDKKFHGFARGDKGEAPAGSFDGYVPLVAEIMKFFRTGTAPVTPEETIEIFAFMQAAEVSKARGGAAVKISEVLKF